MESKEEEKYIHTLREREERELNLVVINNGDGTVGILAPAPDCDLTLAEIIEKDAPKEKSNRIVDRSKIPTDRYFRAAWTDDNPTETVDVDMDRARIVHMDNIRRVRNRELERLDKEQLKGNDVAAEKQVLRDLPANFDLSGPSTPEDLKALWPDELPGRG